MWDGLPDRRASRQPWRIRKACLTPRRAPSVLGTLVLGLALLVSASPGAASVLSTQQRPHVTVSGDGLQASDGQRTLRVGQSQGLPAEGTTVGVSGSGYDTNKGIYVALCVVTPADAPPSPCGGGIDQTGATGASAWVSSNPPSYGQGLATPYGAGGTFSVNVTASPVIADGFDCRQIQCAIVTRNDHVRTADRSQDVFIPVTFAAGEAPPPVTAPPTSAVPTTTAPPTTIAPPPAPTTTAPEPAPTTEISDDGLSGTDGIRTLRLSAAADLDPEAEAITVEGEGFDTGKGVQITLCRTPESPTEAPTPCRAGASPDASSVVLPADAGADTALATFADDGSFEVELEVAAVIDAENDCREVDCAVVVRRYAVADEEAELAAADRTLDMVVPVAFAAASPEPTTTTTEAPAEEAEEEVAAPTATVADSGGEDSSALPFVVGGLVLVVAAGVGTGLVVRVRRSGATG